jgi:hypothetical protein
MHGNNTRKLPMQLSLSQTNKNAMFLFLSSYVFYSIKLENRRVEQVLPGRRDSKAPELGIRWH